MTDTPMPRVLILGGGFAGLAAARALRAAVRRGQCAVTLLDRNPHTTMVPALPDYAAGLVDKQFITESIPNLLPPGVAWRQAQVTGINLAAGRVQTAGGEYRYDYLVIAMGSIARPPPDAWSGQPDRPLATFEDAGCLRRDFARYLEQASRPHVLISGAGYTGVELAGALCLAARRTGKNIACTLLERRDVIMPFLLTRQKDRVLESLRRQGIRLLANTTIAVWDGRQALLSDGQAVPEALLCRTEGTCAPVMPQGDGLERLPDGRLKVAPGLNQPDYPNVYAAGDAAAISTRSGYLRKAVNFAIFSGSQAGRNIARALDGRPPCPFRPVDLGWVIPLADDSVGRAFGVLPLQGRAGLMLHYFMCGYRNFNLRNFKYFAGKSWLCRRRIVLSDV